MRRLVILFGVTVLFWAGCAPKVELHTLRPAQAQEIGTIRRIAVLPMEEDWVGLREKIEARAVNVRVEGEPWYTVVGRRDIQRILAELRFQHSGLTDETTIREVGRIVGADALVTGRILAADVQDTRFRRKRYECLDKKCKERRLYYVYCTKRRAHLSAQVRIVETEQGRVLFAKNYRSDDEREQCSDRSDAFPGRETMLDNLTDEVADDFIRDVAPHYVTFEVELMDEPDIDYNTDQKRRLEEALECFDHGRYERAARRLAELLRSTDERSVTAAYDLGVAKEALGDLEAARALYRLADRLTPTPDERIDRALLRVEQALKARQEMKEHGAR